MQYSEIQIKETEFRIKMYNVNECDKQTVNCFRKQNTNRQIYTMIPPSSLLKSTSSTDLYTEIEERIPNITNIEDFTDFTIYRGEIHKNTIEIQRLPQIS